MLACQRISFAYDKILTAYRLNKRICWTFSNIKEVNVAHKSEVVYDSLPLLSASLFLGVCPCFMVGLLFSFHQRDGQMRLWIKSSIVSSKVIKVRVRETDRCSDLLLEAGCGERWEEKKSWMENPVRTWDHTMWRTNCSDTKLHWNTKARCKPQSKDLHCLRYQIA